MTNEKRFKGRIGRSASKKRRGTIIVLAAVAIPVMLLLAAIAINLAYIDLSRTELYTAADAAARAAGREFTVTQNEAQALARGKQIARLNRVAGQPLILEDEDFSFAKSTRGSLDSRYSFEQTGNARNSIRITARRNSSSATGPISLFMPSVLGRNSVDITQTSTSTAVEVDIALVLDRSGSMAFAHNEPALPDRVPYSAPEGWAFCDPAPPLCRWRDLVSAVDVFLTELAESGLNERVSLCTYNHDATTEVPLTDEYSSILNALFPYINSFCAGGTNIGGGILYGVNSLFADPLARPYAAKVIVLMTDGIHNWGDHPLPVAQNAAQDGIQIFTITFAEEADQYLMQQVASDAGGRHFHANSPADLIAAFQEISRRLPNLLTH